MMDRDDQRHHTPPRPHTTPLRIHAVPFLHTHSTGAVSARTDRSVRHSWVGYFLGLGGECPCDKHTWRPWGSWPATCNRQT